MEEIDKLKFMEYVSLAYSEVTHIRCRRLNLKFSFAFINVEKVLKQDNTVYTILFRSEQVMDVRICHVIAD